MTLKMTLFFFLLSSVHAGLFDKKFEIPHLRDSQITYGTAGAEALDPDHIKFFVWNIYKGKLDHFDSDFLSEAVDTDIFMLQEVVDNSLLHDVYSQLPDTSFNMGISFIHDKKTVTGSAIGSPVKASRLGILRTKDVEPFIHTPKVVTYGHYPIGNSDKELLVVNIHGLNMTKTRPFIRQLEDCARVIESHRGPVVFAGDFNTRNKRRLKAMYKIMDKLGMEEVKFDNDTRKKSKLSFNRYYIDFSFVKGLEIKSSKVMDEFKSSDHKAMIFEARVK